MRNMKSIRIKTKELQSNKVEASDFTISQIRISHPVPSILKILNMTAFRFPMEPLHLVLTRDPGSV